MRLFLLAIIVFTSITCSPKIRDVYISDFTQAIPSEEEENYKRPGYESINNCPDEYHQNRTIRCNVHFIDSPARDNNYSLDEGRKYMKAAMKYANGRLGKNDKMTLPIGNNTPVLDPGFRYVVVPATNDPEDDGFYLHIEEKEYYFLHKGKKKNNYKKNVISKHVVGGDSILNIFVMAQPNDSIKSKTYRVKSTGIALGTSIKISGLFHGGHESWFHAGLINHEIGHVLGLAHAWTKHDGCDDTPSHPNCFDANAPAPCDGPHSNNVMDYNNQQLTYTPCQIGKIHKGLNRFDSRTRKLLVKDWCKLDVTKTIIISDHVEWKGDRDIRHNIIITDKGRLDIHGRTAMPAGSSIIVEGRGQLHLHSFAHLHNDCGELWEGIRFVKNKKEPVNFFVYKNPRMKDINPVGLNTN